MSDESVAVVSSVPAQYRGRVLTQANFMVAMALFVVQILLTLAICLLPAILSVGIANLVAPVNKDLSFLPILAGLGLTFAMLWFLIGKTMRHPWSSGYMFYKTRTEFSQRPDAIVDINNPDAILVEVIPVETGGHIGPRSSEDQGLILVDLVGRQLLFEGDNKRYQIPAQAVTSCEVEMMNPDWQKDERSVPVAVVVLNIRDRDLGEREVSIRPMRTVGGDPLGGNYVERANELHSRLLSLLAV